jgi:hypothetical protein
MRYIELKVRKPEVKKHLEDLGIDGKEKLKRNFQQNGGCLDWTSFAQHREKRPALVKKAKVP